MEGADTVAAVFLEPVQNSGGCFPPPPGYLERVREICDQYDVLFVADETICAFGRIGEMFATSRFGVTPAQMAAEREAADAGTLSIRCRDAAQHARYTETEAVEFAGGGVVEIARVTNGIEDVGVLGSHQGQQALLEPAHAADGPVAFITRADVHVRSWRAFRAAGVPVSSSTWIGPMAVRHTWVSRS